MEMLEKREWRGFGFAIGWVGGWAVGPYFGHSGSGTEKVFGRLDVGRVMWCRCADGLE